MIPSPSRSHCTTAPVTKVDPSSAKVGLLSSRQAIVVSNRFSDRIAVTPVVNSAKQPVPSVT